MKHVCVCWKKKTYNMQREKFESALFMRDKYIKFYLNGFIFRIILEFKSNTCVRIVYK